MKQHGPKFDNGYRLQLIGYYKKPIADQIADTQRWRQVELSAQPGKTVTYAHVSPVDGERNGRKLFFVAGFGESAINKASMGAEFAAQGNEIILPNQNRTGILRNSNGKKDAAYTLARTNLDILKDVLDPREVPDVLTHSYGSLVFQAMRRMDPERFEHSNVVMLAPSGSVENDSLPHLSRRWLSYMRLGFDESRHMEFPDHSGVTGNASAGVLAANIPRTLREIGDLAHGKMDYVEIARGVGSLTLVNYKDDRLFPDDLTGPYIAGAFQQLESTESPGAVIRWISPVSPFQADGTPGSSARGATHDDEQYNPNRVVNAVRQILSTNAS